MAFRIDKVAAITPNFSIDCHIGFLKVIQRCWSEQDNQHNHDATSSSRLYSNSVAKFQSCSDDEDYFSFVLDDEHSPSRDDQAFVKQHSS
jgi:hypothetical protein